MKNILIILVGAIIVGGAAFFGGTKYQQSKAASVLSNGQFPQRNGNAITQRRGRFGANAGVAMGEIISVDSNSITVKMQDGSSKIVNISNSTKFSKMSSAAKSDLKTGDRVAAFGTNNSDGSISAQDIQLNPLNNVEGRRVQATVVPSQ